MDLPVQTRPRRRAPLRWRLLLVLWPLVGCGAEGGERAGAAARTVELEYGDEFGTARPSASYRTLEPPAGLSPWRVTGGGQPRVEPIAHRVRGELRLAGDRPALSFEPASGATLTIPGPFDAEAFNRVQVLLRTPSDATFELALVREGRPAVVSEPQVFPGYTLDAARFEAILGDPRPGAPPFDALELRFGPGADWVDVLRVDLAWQEPREWFPTPDAPALVELGGERRRAVGLPVDSSLTARLPDEAGDRLHLVLGAGRETWRFSGGATCVARVTDADGRAVERRLAAEDLERGSWSTVGLDLAPLGRGRELWLELVGGAATGASALAVGEVRVLGSASVPRTVLLVTSDTHRADHLGLLEDGAPVATPTLDALAARGIVFERAFASSCNTVPSHAALMTGRVALELGVTGNATALGDGATTLAERFAAAGYVTVGVTSARHVAHERSGLGRGFERFSAPRLGVSRTSEATHAVLGRWLDDLEPLPVFVWLHVFDAHGPYDPPDAFEPELPAERNPETYREWVRARYRGEIAYLDRELGRLLARPRFDDALVCFTSDHGESLGTHGIDFDHISLYPEMLRVPLVLAWPGAPAGTRIDARVRQRDVGPTLLELAGLEADGLGAGLPLAPGAEDRAVVSVDVNARSVALTEGPLHLILSLREHRLHPGNDANPRVVERHAVELYDLCADPGATRDLAAERPDDARRMRAELIAYLGTVPPRGSVQASRSAALLKDLEALGYGAPPAPGDTEPWFDPDCGCAECARWR